MIEEFSLVGCLARSMGHPVQGVSTMTLVLGKTRCYTESNQRGKKLCIKHEESIHMVNMIAIIFIIKGFQSIVFIFIVISTMFPLICPLAFFRCLSNSGTYTELQTTSFIESTGVACSDSRIRTGNPHGFRNQNRWLPWIQ